MLKHIFPNCLPPLIVIATIDLAHAIALESTLSFLGVGVPVTEPSLGMLIANGFEFMLSGHYWISFFPGIALALANELPERAIVSAASIAAMPSRASSVTAPHRPSLHSIRRSPACGW